MKTVLIVDDEKHCLSLYQRELEERGYRVLTAVDGESGLQLAQQERPDCIVVDIRLPGMDGLALISRVLAMDPSIPVVINSAYHDAKDDFTSWCARAYVVKSSNVEALTEAVAGALHP